MEINYASISNDFGFLEKSGHIQTWPLPKVLSGLIFLIPTYLVLVTKVLPQYMKSREPLQLKKVILFYNALQVALSGYTFFIYLQYVYNHGVITTGCPKGADLLEVSNKIFPYFLAKHLDLLDTVFFVLRKKDNQVTFLHVYHHSTMVSWSWLYYLYLPNDNFVVLGLLNCLVHVLMYTYYAISLLGPKYARYVLWKKHLTKIQLIQFVLSLVHIYCQQMLSPCPLPGWFYTYAMTVMCSFFILFLKFYFNKY